jgi:hypothetical protein
VPPSLIIRLRVGDPLYYETTTNLTFQTVRRFEAHVYAEIIDTSGRVLYAASGHDSQKISVTNGLDLDPNARLEIAVKNALLSLAEDVGKLAEARQDSSPVRQANEQGVLVSTADKSLPAGMAGFVLRPTELVVAGKKVKFNVPIAESHVDRRVGTDTKLKGLWKINQTAPVTAAGDLWEVMQLGPTPRSPRSFGLCADSENLGSVATPEYEGIVSIATAKGMPGAYYAPEIKTAADKIISAQTGFRDGISWDMPELSSCIQPVQRVDVLGEKCDKDGTCQSQVSRRFTLRVRSADTVVLKEGSESKGITEGYGKTTKPADLSKLVQSDAVDEARKLLESIVQKLNLNVIAN